ncbi:tetratricopeptide repeat protein [Idiomarina seosinensis]|uniref:SirB1 family protein n=1 Tax=Idiomarina seosinensis TaxID=281739 RepID=UPI00384B79EA
MQYSFLQQCEQQLVPTIEMVWEISRQLELSDGASLTDFRRQLEQAADIDPQLDIKQQIKQLSQLFYRQLGYSDAPESWVPSHRVAIDQVVAYRTGIPLVLAILLKECAQQQGLELQVVDFPGYPLLKMAQADETYFIDPQNGQLVDYQEVVARFDEVMDGDADFCWDWAEPTPQKALLEGYLTELKQCLMAEARYEKALRCVQMLLTLQPDDPYEIRDRGYLYEELGCQHVAVDDYQYFVDQCPDDPSAELLKLQLEGYSGPQHLFH